MVAAPEFLVVDELIDGFLALHTTAAALDLGLVDHLVAAGSARRADLPRALRVDAAQLDILLDLLVHRGVLAEAGDALRPSDRLLEALRFRDLLEVKIDYARRVGRAMFDHYAPSIRDPGTHLSKLIDFFVFDRREDYPPETLEVSRLWVRYMSTLTRYQAPLLAEAHDFAASRRLLDAGGNNGECALALCRRYPQLEVTVADLPVVCDLGAAHVRAAGLADRVRFLKHDLAARPLPPGFDTILFKSVLHDWPDAAAFSFLAKAHAALPEGGGLVIFEFERYDLKREALPDRDVVNVPFLSHLRPRQAYLRKLEGLGFRDVAVREVPAIHFVLITAVR
jgi:O-methyltransferase domain